MNKLSIFLAGVLRTIKFYIFPIVVWRGVAIKVDKRCWLTDAVEVRGVTLISGDGESMIEVTDKYIKVKFNQEEGVTK